MRIILLFGYIQTIVFSFSLTGGLAEEQISDYIQKCCISGLRNARIKNGCKSLDSSVFSISRIWVGLCSSTFGVCCSRELDHQNCELGRLAALDGSKCDNVDNTTSTSYTNCCQACQVGLAVKASKQNCKDPLFSFLSNIESYRICCSDNSLDDSTVNVKNNKQENDYRVNSQISDAEDFIELSHENTDGTIVLTDDDDICGKVPNLCAHICENTFDAYKCSCRPGYNLDENNVTCSLQNKKDGGICPDGYVMDKLQGKCVDIDECFNNLTNFCKTEMHQECKNTVGSYYCNCLSGYSLDVTQNECVDINECSINNHNCLPTQRCDNTIGSYICTRWTSCGTGYTLNAESGNCDDDDECALKTHNCDSNYECFNTKGSFRCHRKATTSITTRLPATPALLPHTNTNGYRHYVVVTRQPCSAGFHRNTLGACVDINECTEYKPCPNHERCINLNGSFRCESLLQCPTGFKSTPDASSCVDINECETGENNCGDGQICRNRNGGYICACPTGHQVSRMTDGSNACVDINECAQDQPVCSSNSQCFNTIGSYYCECKSGFQKKPGHNGMTGQGPAQCFDVDECQSISGLCQQKCVNFWGGYRCTCHQGYELSHDNRTCNDINECEVHKDYKLCMGFCINSAGSYQCSCPRGYTLAADKTTCRDIDECSTENGNHVCTGRNDICTNIRGSFKCTTVNCPPGYINDLDQKNRCRQNNKFCDGDECYTKPTAYTFNFITFVSRLLISPDGRTIFTLRGPAWYDDIDFDLKIIRIQAATNIEKASENYFDTFKNNNQVNLILKKSLEGPQDIELDLSMTVFSNGMPRGKSVAKIFLFVSQYTF